MARTVSTTARTVATNNSSSEDSSSDDGISDAEAGYDCSAAAVTAAASSTARTSAPTKSPTTAAATIPSKDANYARASSTAASASMSSHRGDDRPPPDNNYSTRRQEMSHASSNQQKRDWSGPGGGRSSHSGRHHHFGRGVRHSYDSTKPSGRYNNQYYRHHDRSFEHEDRRRSSEYYYHSRSQYHGERYCRREQDHQDDGRWKRDQDWDNQSYHNRHHPYDRSYHYDNQHRERRYNQPFAHDNRPGERQSGDYNSGQYDPWHYHSDKRPKYGHRNGPRNWTPPSSQHQHQPRAHEEVRALRNTVAKLQKDITELKKSGPQSNSPTIASNGGAISKEEGLLSTSTSHAARPEPQNTETGSIAENVLQTTEISQTGEHQAHIVQNESLCYDKSTDDEANNFTQDGQGKEKDDEVEDTTVSQEQINVTGSDKGSNNEENAPVQDDHSNITDSHYSDEDSVDIVLQERIDADGKIAFCCQNCRCWKTAPTKYKRGWHIRNNCGNSGSMGYGNTKIYHKGCCHGDAKAGEDYVSPMAKAIEESINGENKKRARRMDSWEQIKRTFNTAKREEARFENEELDEAKDCSNYSNKAYQEECRNFQQRDKARRSPLRVLDLFSGIGSGTLVLKRLGLPIESIVHVEHDPVANIVSKYNHQNDGITHRYIETFEAIYGSGDEADSERVESLVAMSGPFDLVLSGAPCQSYSGLNANRDASSENAQYLCKVGRLIQALDKIQIRLNPSTDRVLFLSENVVFKNHDKVDKCYTEEEGGLTPICLDAKDFGPCKRNRFYWMNMPVKSTEAIKLVASAVSIDSLLDEGFGAVARLLMSGEELENLPVKSNAFLASLSRIDDGRMIRYKLEGSNKKKTYEIETYSVGERERMMGLPTGYVEKAIHQLFSDLTENAFLQPEVSPKGKTYKDFLDKKLWHFRKKCHFKFQPSSVHPYFQLALSSPQEGKLKEDFYTEEQYCKHLVGNGWSIPVVEHLLGSLRNIFADDVLKTYDQFTYQHPWEPYSSM